MAGAIRIMDMAGAILTMVMDAVILIMDMEIAIQVEGIIIMMTFRFPKEEQPT